jgi:hypothetical protein
MVISILAPLPARCMSVRTATLLGGDNADTARNSLELSDGD